MKKSSRIVTGIVVVLAFIVGFIVGTQVNFTNPDKSDLAGTIGKIKKMEKFKIEENDPELRSKLNSDATKLKDYQKYFTYQNNTCEKLINDIGIALKAAEDEALFSEQHKAAIDGLKAYEQKLLQLKTDLEVAVSTLADLTEVDQQTLTSIIKQANEAASRVSYKNKSVVAFVDSLEKFLLGSNPYLFHELIKAHDLLSVNSLIPAV